MRLKTDWILFLTVVLMVAFGIVMVYSASSIVAPVQYKVSSYHYVVRQMMAAVVAFLAMMYMARRDYRRLLDPRYVFTAVGAVLLLTLLAYALDHEKHRWLSLGFVSLQPSELAKPVLAVFLAYLVAMRGKAINNWHTLLPAAVVVGAMTVSVGLADLGTAVVMAVMAVVVLYVAGLERRNFVAAVVLGLVVVTMGIIYKPYRLWRVVEFLDPQMKVLAAIDKDHSIRDRLSVETKSRDTGYQGEQSEIAIGSGGMFGVGLMQSRQKQMYVPEVHTDFILAVIGEELGLWGCTAVLAGYLIIMWRGLRLFWNAPDEFGKYIALGIVSFLVIQALLNITVALNMVPTKGITLPMLSYGGSSLVATLASLGLLMSISERAG